MIEKCPSVAIAHPGLEAGGSEAVAMWALQALQGDFDLTLLTGAPVEWDRLNGMYGTRVNPQAVRVLEAPMPSFLKSGRVGNALYGAFFQRYCRRVGMQFDLCVSTYNIVDFGRAGLQFLADFSWAGEIAWDSDKRRFGLRGLMQNRSFARTLYLAVVSAIGGDVVWLCRPDDTIVANSNWSANILESRYGVCAKVIYPPVSYQYTKSPEVLRTPDFVVLGRISPEKRVEEAIEIIGAIRRRGHNVTLHVLGSFEHAAYARHVRRLAQKAGSWVVLHGGLYSDAKARMLERHGFGLHLRRDEAFGIAVAEMVKAGVVPFVPASGAPAEIVADERLLFKSFDDAVERIDAVLRNGDDVEDIRARLRARGELFSADRFVTDFRSLVMDELRRSSELSGKDFCPT